MEESFETRQEIRSPYQSVLQKVQSAAKKLGSLLWNSETPATKLTFHICALSRPTLATVKELLQAKLEGLLNTTEIRNDAVATLTAQDETNITALQSVDVGVEIGITALLLLIFTSLQILAPLIGKSDLLAFDAFFGEFYIANFVIPEP